MTKQKLKDLVTEFISPVLKQNGYRKKGLTWNCKEGLLTKVINLQLSQWNTDLEISFTLNIGVFVPEAYEICWNKKSPEFVQESDCIVRQRIGELIDSSFGKRALDKWWQLDQQSDVDQVGKDVQQAITKFALPFLGRFESLLPVRDFLLDAVRKHDALPLYIIYAAIAEYLTGNQEASICILSSLPVSERNKYWLVFAERVKDRLKILTGKG